MCLKYILSAHVCYCDKTTVITLLSLQHHKIIWRITKDFHCCVIYLNMNESCKLITPDSLQTIIHRNIPVVCCEHDGHNLHPRQLVIWMREQKSTAAGDNHICGNTSHSTQQNTWLILPSYKLIIHVFEIYNSLPTKQYDFKVKEFVTLESPVFSLTVTTQLTVTVHQRSGGQIDNYVSLLST